MVVATLLNLLTPELLAGVPDFLATCQTYEGGFGNASFPGWAFEAGMLSERTTGHFLQRLTYHASLPKMILSQRNRRTLHSILPPLGLLLAKLTADTPSAPQLHGLYCSPISNIIMLVPTYQAPLPYPFVQKSTRVGCCDGARKCKGFQSSSVVSGVARTS